jgi:hypothetical protein
MTKSDKFLWPGCQTGIKIPWYSGILVPVLAVHGVPAVAKNNHISLKSDQNGIESYGKKGNT